MDLNEILGIKIGYNLHDKHEFEIVRDFIIRNGYSVSNFDKNLSKLILEENMRKKKLNEIPKYDTFSNKIDGKASGSNFIHELFHMSSNINNGNDEMGAEFLDGTGESLNEGITEYLTLCVSKNQKSSYPIEVLFFEFLSQMYPEIGKQIIGKYFEGKPNDLYDLFGENRSLILSAVKELDKYTRYNKNNSLVAIQMLYKISGNDNELRIKTTNNLIDESIIQKKLINAFSILINDFKVKNKEYSLDLIDDFECCIIDIYGEEVASGIMEKFSEKVGMEKSL